MFSQNFSLTSDTFHFRVTGEPRWTAALFNVTLHVAFRIYSARGLHVTRIQALSIETHI